ncbi:MAG: hypothetical protein Q9163_006406 [Psora crenata]
MDIPLKATPSPPSATSSNNTLSPTSSPVAPIADPSYASLSHPDWPKSDTLSSATTSPLSTRARTSCVNGGQASCYISDEDLIDLEQLPLYNDIRVPEHFAAYGYGHRTTKVEENRSRDLPPVRLQQVLPPTRRTTSAAGKRKRTVPSKKTKLVLGMSPIPEAE